MKKPILTLLFLLCFVQKAFVHPLNLTVTDLSYQSGIITMKIKFFADDFQSSLSQSIKKPVDFINQPLTKSQEAIKLYIGKRLSVSINGKATKWKYKKMWLASDVMFVEYETAYLKPETIKSIRVKDELLFDDFPEQKNIVNINLKDETKILNFENNGKKEWKEVLFE